MSFLQHRFINLTSEDDGVEAGLPPQLHEVNHITETQGRVTGKHHAWLTELAAEAAMDGGVVLQLVGLDQLNRPVKEMYY